MFPATSTQEGRGELTLSQRAEAGQHRRGCIECGAAESPCWRMGPAGPLTLCNVCGLLFAKRSEVAATIGERGGEGEDEEPCWGR